MIVSIPGMEGNALSFRSTFSLNPSDVVVYHAELRLRLFGE